MENNESSGLESNIHHVSVNKTETTPRDEAVAYQVGAVLYNGEPEPGVTMPGIMINTSPVPLILQSDVPGSLDNTIMIGLRDPNVVFQLVASGLMAILDGPQIDRVMELVTSLLEDNDRESVLSVMHQEMYGDGESSEMDQEVSNVDLDALIRQMLNIELNIESEENDS